MQSMNDYKGFVEHMTMLTTSAAKQNEIDHGTKYVLNIVRTRAVDGNKKQTRTLSMAIVSCNSFIYACKSMLILTLDKYFATPQAQLLGILLDSLNKYDLTTLPRLPLMDRMLLRGGCSTVLYADEDASCSDVPATLVTPKRFARFAAERIGANQDGA